MTLTHAASFLAQALGGGKRSIFPNMRVVASLVAKQNDCTISTVNLWPSPYLENTGMAKLIEFMIEELVYGL